MAIGAVEFDRSAWLGVKFAGSVGILFEMAIDAVHSFFEMNVRQVNGLLEFCGIVGGDDSIFGIK